MNKFTKIGLVVCVLAMGLGYVGRGIYNQTGEAEGSDEQQGRPIKNALSLKAPSLPSSERELTIVQLNLSSDNLVVFREDFNALSVANAQQDLIEKDKRLASGKPIYLLLDTPGGSIPAGNALIDTAKSLGRPVHTITVFAASMGFNTAQRLGTRYILPSGELMAHRARVGGVGGQIPGEFLTAAATLYRLVEKQERYNAKRLRITFEAYTELVRDEYWVDGEDAVRQGAADQMVSIKCDDSLKGTSTQAVRTMFGTVNVIWSNCPAVTLPIGAVFGKDEAQNELLRRALSDYRGFRKLVAEQFAQGAQLQR